MTAKLNKSQIKNIIEEVSHAQRAFQYIRSTIVDLSIPIFAS